MFFVSVQGCAFFSGKADVPPLPPDLAATTHTLPLPVEVAQDISIIAKGGTVAPINPPLPGRKPAAETPETAKTDSDKTEQSPEAERQPQTEKDPTCNCVKRKTSSVAKAKPIKGPTKRNAVKGDEDYTVKKEDTLMKISFEKYGNVYRWREIYNENKDRIPDYNQLVEGTILKVKGVEYVVIERNGLPYLIRRNDTLVKISRGLYNTPKRWKHLWDNNRQLIHDPNKIYAGFTLYYQPDGVTKPSAAKLNLKGPLRDRLPAGKK